MDILFDTHAHLDFPDFDRDRDAVLARAEAAGVRYIATVGAGGGLEASARAVALAEARRRVWAIVGVHPHDARLVGDFTPELMRLAAHPKVVAIGETGLDFFKEHSPRERQVECFREHLRVARELGLPVVIHDREAHEDTLRLLRQDGVGPRGGIMHCFSGDAALAAELVALGFYISIPGVITFDKTGKLQEVARAVPRDRLLVETDCPFLAPVPHRGKRNEPAYVRLTAEAVARARGETPAELAAAVTRNAARVFGLSLD